MCSLNYGAAAKTPGSPKFLIAVLSYDCKRRRSRGCDVLAPGCLWDECDRLGAVTALDLGELFPGSREAHPEAFDFSAPAFVLGFGDAGDEIVLNL
jgi:hypothetical protein